MSINDLLKAEQQRASAPGTTIRLPPELRERLKAANNRLQACGYKPIPLQQLAVAALQEAVARLEKMTAA